MPTKTWTSMQTKRAAIQPYTVGATVPAGATYKMATVSSLFVIVTAIAGDTPTTIAAALATAINTSAYPGFTDLVATSLVDVLTLTGPADGAPITTPTVTVTGTGATLTAGTATTPTSPHDLKDAANWSGAAFPVTSDTILFPPGTLAVKYGFDGTFGALTGIAVRQAGGPTIGLPDIGAKGAMEWRPRFLDGFATTWTVFTTTDNDLTCRIDTNTSNIAFTVFGTLANKVPVDLMSQPLSASRVVNVVGTGLRLTPRAATAGATTNLTATSAKVEVLAGVPLNAVKFIAVQAIMAVGFATLSQDGSSNVRVINSDGAPPTGTCTPSIDGGTLFWDANGTLTAPNIGSGGTLSFATGGGAVAISGVITRNEGGKVNDTTARVTRPYTIVQNRTDLGSDAMGLGTNFRITVND